MNKKPLILDLRHLRGGSRDSAVAVAQALSCAVMTTMTEAEAVAAFKTRVDTSATFRIELLRWLYQRQAEGKRKPFCPRVRNHAGFDCIDAERLGVLAEQSYRRDLTEDEHQMLSKRLPRYVRQYYRQPSDSGHERKTSARTSPGQATPSNSEIRPGSVA